MNHAKLYVGNLSYDATEDDLREAFSLDGRTVRDVYMPVDRDTKVPRGFAFVELGSAEEADAAIAAMDGYELLGRPLRVNEAKPKKKT